MGTHAACKELYPRLDATSRTAASRASFGTAPILPHPQLYQAALRLPLNRRQAGIDKAAADIAFKARPGSFAVPAPGRPFVRKLVSRWLSPERALVETASSKGSSEDG